MATNNVDTPRERERMLQPACRVCEEQDGRIVIVLEMPGVSKDDLELHYEDNTLQITGRRQPVSPEGSYLVRERRAGSFYRAYTVDDTIDPQSIEASVADGILTVTLYRKEAEKPRRITIKSG